MTHYIHDEKNNRIEGLSKEEIYALLAAAIQQGQLPSVDADTAFVTMFKSIVDGQTYKMGFCTQAQYNAMEAGGTLEANALYIITDDTSYDDIITYIDNIKADLLDAIGANAANITNLENNKVNKYGTFETLTSFINNAGNVEINSRNTDNTYQCYIDVQAGGIDFYKKANGNVTSFDIFELAAGVIIPINVPITQNKTIDITNYGAGLYVVVVENNDGSPKYYTRLMTIVDSGTVTYSSAVKYAHDLIATNSSLVIEINGYYYKESGEQNAAINILSSAASLKFISCKQLIKF